LHNYEATLKSLRSSPELDDILKAHVCRSLCVFAAGTLEVGVVDQLSKYARNTSNLT
jgi:hypothetical protein